MALVDLTTDGVTCAKLLRGEIAISNDAYKYGYVTILCFGVVTTAVSLAYRIHNARLVRDHIRELRQQDRRISAAQRQAAQHEYELKQNHRSKVNLSLSLMTVAAEGETL